MYICQASSKQKAFKALVLTVLDYVCTVWNPHTQKNILALEKIQNCGAHWVCGSRFNPHTSTWSKSSSDFWRELHWPSLSTRRKYLSITTIYDMLHHYISSQFSSFFTFSTSPTRSHPLSILCKHSSINAYRYFFSINSIFSWNRIPFNILSVSRHSCFKHSLCSFLCLN